MEKLPLLDLPTLPSGDLEPLDLPTLPSEEKDYESVPFPHIPMDLSIRDFIYGRSLLMKDGYKLEIRIHVTTETQALFVINPSGEIKRLVGEINCGKLGFIHSMLFINDETMLIVIAKLEGDEESKVYIYEKREAHKFLKRNVIDHDEKSICLAAGFDDEEFFVLRDEIFEERQRYVLYKYTTEYESGPKGTRLLVFEDDRRTLIGTDFNGDKYIKGLDKSFKDNLDIYGLMFNGDKLLFLFKLASSDKSHYILSISKNGKLALYEDLFRRQENIDETPVSLEMRYILRGL
jgi:hypothetical protein